MRTKMVAANWKMNKFLVEGLQLASDILVSLEKNPPKHPVVICPPFIHLADLQRLFKETSYIHLGAQNCYYADSGAFTGEISVPMLASLGVRYVIAGHSERRQIFCETDEIVSRKVKAILLHGLRPIFCCGEPLAVREKNQHFSFVEQQISASLLPLSAEEISSVTIAYEPIWAIGTGVNATPQQAQEMHAFIRSLIEKRFGNTIAQNMTLLYGGSVNPANATSLFNQTDVDGGLVGGASLKADDFVKIIRALA
ncbi:MAG: triosephosphate isomerase [Chitinophagales bacterium]|nr:MAG: triosephosphate isomerase [Chitinophagales bacterium]